MKPRAILAATLLVCAAPAFAQMYKCVDARGRTHYTDKPGPDCKGGPVEMRIAPAPAPRPASPAQGAVTKSAAAKPREKPQAAVDPAQLEGLCRGWREEQAWLNRQPDDENRGRRLSQVEQALRACR